MTDAVVLQAMLDVANERAATLESSIGVELMSARARIRELEATLSYCETLLRGYQNSNGATPLPEPLEPNT